MLTTTRKKGFSILLSALLICTMTLIWCGHTERVWGASEATTGTWVLTSKGANFSTDYTRRDNQNTNTYAYRIQDGGVLKDNFIQLIVTGGWYGNKSSDNNTAAYYHECSQPKSSYASGETAAMTMRYYTKNSTSTHYNGGCSISCYDPKGAYFGVAHYGNFEDSSGNRRLYDRDGYTYYEGNLPVKTLKGTFTFPKTSVNGEKMDIVFQVNTAQIYGEGPDVVDGDYSAYNKFRYIFYKWSYTFKAGGSSGSSGGSSAQKSVSDYKLVLSNFNTESVYNDPPKATTLIVRPGSQLKLQAISLYHYNYGSGSSPGTITLKKGSKTVGTWKASGNRYKNYYWDVFPNIMLSAGTYTISCSNNSTWSYNSGSADMGFTEIYGVVSNAAKKPGKGIVSAIKRINKKQIKVTVKKVSGAKKYQIRYKIGKAKKWKVVSKKSNSFQVKKKKGKKIQVQARITNSAGAGKWGKTKSFKK